MASQHAAVEQILMSIKTTVISQIEQVAEEMGIKADLPPLTEDLVLTNSGLDSLAIAILVTRLEDKLGFDPFTQSSDGTYPVTLGDFIRFYEDAATCADVSSGQDR